MGLVYLGSPALPPWACCQLRCPTASRSAIPDGAAVRPARQNSLGSIDSRAMSIVDSPLEVELQRITQSLHIVL